MSKRENKEIAIAGIVVALIIGALLAIISIGLSSLDTTTKYIGYIAIAFFIYVVWNELHKRFFLKVN